MSFTPLRLKIIALEKRYTPWAGSSCMFAELRYSTGVPWPGEQFNEAIFCNGSWEEQKQARPNDLRVERCIMHTKAIGVSMFLLLGRAQKRSEKCADIRHIMNIMRHIHTILKATLAIPPCSYL